MAKKNLKGFNEFTGKKMNAKELIKFLTSSKEAKALSKRLAKDDNYYGLDENGGLNPNNFHWISQGDDWKEVQSLVGPVEQMEDEVSKYSMVGPQDDEAGTSWSEVWYFKAHDVYLRLSGWDSSQGDGEIYDEYEVVKPHKITVTIYK